MKYRFILSALLMAIACNRQEKKVEILSTAEINAQHPVVISMETVDFEQVIELIKNKKVVILDVRTAVEYREGHIPHAVNIDIEAENFETQILNLNPENHYLVYSSLDVKSDQACAKLEKNHFKSIKNYRESWMDWIENKGIVEKSN